MLRFKNKTNNIAAAFTKLNFLSKINLLPKNIIERNVVSVTMSVFCNKGILVGYREQSRILKIYTRLCMWLGLNN